jgi:LCP family protein required for cell wall assembly
VFSFLGRFAIALLLVVAIAVGGFVSAQAYGKREFGKSKTIHIDDLTPTRQGEPANFLLIGSDVRPADESAAEAKAYGTAADTGPQHSDVMIVLHVDPASHTGKLVSFPRDLMVDIPGHGRNQLNAAFAFGSADGGTGGGASLVIKTLEQNFAPMKINHYLEVDFRGFKKIVDEIGHIHIWFSTPAHDPYTGLDVPAAGCVSLDGDQALAYARSRHYYVPKDVANPAPWNWDYATSRGGDGWVATGSDIDRIPRQQYFLRTVSQAAIDKTGQDPLAVLRVLDAIFENLGHDQNLKSEELNALALTFRGLKPSKVEMSTLPTVSDPTDRNRVVAKFPDAVGVINQLAQFTAPKTPIVKPMSADRIKVRVINGSGVKNAAAHVLDTFEAAGFHSAGPPADADRADYNTEVRYAPGKFREGYTVAVAVGTIHLVEAPSAKNTFGGDVLVIVGRDYDSLRHRFDLIPRPANLPPPSSTTTSVAPHRATTSTTARPAVDTRFVPVDPRTGGTLVGCPAK